MILLVNVKITSQGLSRYDRAEWLPKFDRVDIFKYCLASYAALAPLVSRYEFYIELAPEFADRKDELEDYIQTLFPRFPRNYTVNLNWYRHYYSRDWKKWCNDSEITDDDVIWFAGNDDHIFIDRNLDVIESGIINLKNDTDKLSQIYYSHWPEQIRLSYSQGGVLTEDKNYIVRPWRTFDAITIMLGKRWRKYWFDQDWGDTPVWRTDALWHLGYELTGPVYVPTRELVRHYDGYSHTGKEVANITPPLVIPRGFFHNNINIHIGYDRNDGVTNFNPLSEWLYNFSKSGADYRWLSQDIPLFWKDRINSITTNSEDYSTLIEARNSAYLASTRIPLTTYSTTFDCNNSAPTDWFKNNLI